MYTKVTYFQSQKKEVMPTVLWKQFFVCSGRLVLDFSEQDSSVSSMFRVRRLNPLCSVSIFSTPDITLTKKTQLCLSASHE